MMEKQPVPLANVITLGTRNFAVMRSFYQKLDWPMIFDDGEFAAFELRGIVLALFPLEKLASDAREKPERSQGGVRFSIGILVDEAAQVDEMAQKVRAAGGRITKEPVDAEFFEGRSCYFADPEDNYWEIVWSTRDNPVTAAAFRAARIE